MFNKSLITAYQIRGRMSAEEMMGQINWGSATDVFSRSEVINSGTLIEAFNAGGTTSGSDQTVNGVLFTGTSALLPLDNNGDFYSGDTADEAYNALLSSGDSSSGKSVTLKVGGGKLKVGTEYTIQVWYVDTTNKVEVTVGDGEKTENVVTLKTTPELRETAGKQSEYEKKRPEKGVSEKEFYSRVDYFKRKQSGAPKSGLTGQFVVGTFVARAGTQTITLASPKGSDVHLTAYQIRDRVSAEEMMAHFKRQLSQFPKYSWDKVTRWGYARKSKWRDWNENEVHTLAPKCKYIYTWDRPPSHELFKKLYPDAMYCFESYTNLGKVYRDPKNPEHCLYNSKGELITYSTGHKKYNLANPDCRECRRRGWLR